MEIYKTKRTGLCESLDRDLSRKVNNLSEIAWDRKITKDFTRSIRFNRIG